MHSLKSRISYFFAASVLVLAFNSAAMEKPVLESMGKAKCTYSLASDKVVVNHTEDSQVEADLVCPDYSDAETEKWLNLLNNYGKNFSRHQVNDDASESNSALIAQSALEVARAYTCATIRSAYEIDTALEMISLTAGYARRSGDETILKSAQNLSDILNKNSPAATKDIRPCQRRGYFMAIPDSIWQQMQGRSWHRDKKCPARETLVFARIPFIGFDGKSHVGDMILAKSSAAKVLNAFAEIYAAGFRIEAMELIDKYDGDDAKSMAANNTSAFNCRAMTSSSQMSEHSTGRAIDINPLQNPWVSASRVEPATSQFSRPAQRTVNTMGLIQKDGAAVRAFAKIGWKWGGSWRSIKDYQHFSETGR